MKLSIIIPAYNEEQTIERLIRKVGGAQLPDGVTREIIVVDDHSADDTASIVEGLKPDFDIALIRHASNAGKGASVTDGLKASTGDVAIIQDADLEYDPAEYVNLLAPIISGDADVVFGSRFISNRPHRVLYFWHYVGNTVLTLFSNVMTNLNISDMETCYKMFTRKVIDDIKGKLVSARFGIEPEITARVKSYRIYEVGISYRGRTYAEGKKIGWKDGFSALWCIVRFNLFP